MQRRRAHARGNIMRVGARIRAYAYAYANACACIHFHAHARARACARMRAYACATRVTMRQILINIANPAHSTQAAPPDLEADWPVCATRGFSATLSHCADGPDSYLYYTCDLCVAGQYNLRLRCSCALGLDPQALKGACEAAAAAPRALGRVVGCRESRHLGISANATAAAEECRAARVAQGEKLFVHEHHKWPCTSSELPP